VLRPLVSEKIKQDLSCETPETRLRAAMMIHYAPEEEQLVLRSLVSEKIKQDLSCETPETRLRAAMMIHYAPEEEQLVLRSLVSEKIKQDLSCETPETRLRAAKMIEFASEEERTALIKLALSLEHPEVQKTAAKMIWYIPKKERVELIKIAFNAGLGNAIIESPLYRRSNLNNERFARENFEKTGSKTTLLGGSLIEKLIIRHINPKAFLAWQKIYENYQIWINNEFDYVPIEPIQAYRFNSDGLVDVFSGVIDLSLTKWLVISGGMFENELLTQKDKIISVL